MADTSNLTNFLSDVADAIRTKTGGSEPISAANFDTEIESIPTGGGGDLPSGIFIQEETPTKTTNQAFWLKEEDLSQTVPASQLIPMDMVILTWVSSWTYRDLYTRLTDEQKNAFDACTYHYVGGFMGAGVSYAFIGTNQRPVLNASGSTNINYDVFIQLQSSGSVTYSTSPYYYNEPEGFDPAWTDFDVYDTNGDLRHASDADAPEPGVYIDVNNIRYIVEQSKAGSNIFSKILDTSSATATASDIVANKTAFVNNQKITGAITENTVNIIPTMSQQTISNGFYTNSTVKSIAESSVYDSWSDTATNILGGTTSAGNYTELEYIEFTGSQSINTGITVTNHKVETKFDFVEYNNDEHLFGTTLGAGYYHFTAYSNTYYWGLSGGEGHGGTWTTGIHTLRFNDDDHAIILDNTVLGSGNYITASAPLYIGRRDNSVNLQARIYYFKIYDKPVGNLVRYLIPVKDSNGVVCMYDKVSEQFFYDTNSGANFVAGPEAQKRLEYIEFDQNTYIDTGITATSNLTIQTKFEATTWGTTILGYTNGSENDSFRLFGVGSGTNDAWYYDYGSGQGYNRLIGGNTMNLNTVYELELGNRYVKDLSKPGVSYIYGSQVSFSHNNTIGIGDKPAGSFTGKYYYFKIYDDGVLVRDLVPVKDDNDVVCMYDKVSGNYFYNLGTGDLIAGPSMDANLTETLDSILTEKETKLLPENIKAGVTILGVTGTMT